jgi:hypothetical protein
VQMIIRNYLFFRDFVFFCKPVCPQNKYELERKPDILRHCGKFGMQRRIHRHINIRGKNGNQKCDQAPRGNFLKTRNQQHCTKKNLKHAAQIYQKRISRQNRRHHSLIELRVEKMVCSGKNKGDPENPFENLFDNFHFCVRFK